MGWAIQRPDGTYRCWNANTQDDVLQPGEVWIALDHAPLIMGPPPPNPLKAKIDLVLADATVPPSIKALLAVWKAQLNGH